jgi:PAS domain S-box-containing protein
MGQAHAKIGLVVVADSMGTPHEHILTLVQILAATLTTLVQEHALLARLQDIMKEQNRAAEISRTMEEAVQEGLLLLSPDLTAIKLNQAAELMLGYTNREVRGQPIDKILIGSDSLSTALANAQDGNPTYSLGNVRLYRRSGEAFLAYMRTFPVIHEGAVERILIAIQDLSEQEQIREHTQQLEQRAILGEFTAIFAHEVRNPINNISTGLQVLDLNLAPDDPNRESISRLQQDCDRLTELMKSVLAYSRPTDYQMESFDLEPFLHRWLERLQPRMTRVNVQYNLQVEKGCPQVEGNPRALEQVFTNLMNNAVHAMSESGGSLVVKTQRVQSPEGRYYVEVTLADTGPGIPREIQERIFQPFFTTNRNGTGLGLAIAKRIITAHKGSIRLTSFPGGTIFHVQLPVVGG